MLSKTMTEHTESAIRPHDLKLSFISVIRPARGPGALAVLIFARFCIVVRGLGGIRVV